MKAEKPCDSSDMLYAIKICERYMKKDMSFGLILATYFLLAKYFIDTTK